MNKRKQPAAPAAPAKPDPKAQPNGAGQMGATEKQVQPLTPPMARSDEQPGDPERDKQPDKGIDPADELTPG